MRNLQPVSIGGIEFDAVISSQEDYNAEVPAYPVDSGFSVSDNVAIDAMELTMTLLLTATPITWLSRHGSGEERMDSVCEQLLTLYKTREPVTVITRNKTFTDMVIKTISIEKSEEAVLAREIPITLTQVTVTESAKSEVPAKLAKSGTTKTNAGTGSTSSGKTSSSSGSSGSSGGSSSGGSSGGDSGGESIASQVSNAVNSIKNAVTGGGSSSTKPSSVLYNIGGGFKWW